MNKKRFQKFVHSTFFSLFVLLVLVSLLGYIAYNVTKTYQKEPDFGGMVTLRQANMNLNGNTTDSLHLTRSMILDHITSKEILEPLAVQYGWNLPYEEMVKAIDVKERLSSQNSYIVIANTGQIERSTKIARALSLSFLDSYRKTWVVKSKRQLVLCNDRIQNYQKELSDLMELKVRFQDRNELRPLNTEIEMTALNEQLVEAQNQFLAAYGAYINSMETKRAELQLEYDLASQIYSEDNVELKNMKLKLAELERQCVEIRKKLAQQKPDLYRMRLNPQKLTGLPNDILYFYENVQTLQQLKLALMLNSLIEDKKKMLEQEEEKKNTIQRLLDSKSCDVFIREVTR